jgi:transcriptional regulator with XRE-family HTH domain
LQSTIFLDKETHAICQRKSLIMTPAQCRAARALLDWSQQRLADTALLGVSTIFDFERERRIVSAEAIGKMRAGLEAAGVTFTNGGEPGVKLRSL